MYVPTQLIPKLKDIDIINQEEFSKLTSPIKKYPIDVKGYYPKKGSDKEELRVEVMEAYEEFQSFKVGTQICLLIIWTIKLKMEQEV